MKFLIFILLFAVTASAQLDNYGKKPSTRVEQTEVVKFHVALKLVEGGWTPEQRAALIDQITEPRLPTRKETGLFTIEQFRDIFHAIGTVKIDRFKAVFHMSVLWDKRKYWASLDKPGRAEIWRQWFAYNLATRKLDAEQIEALIKMSDAANRQNADEAEAIDLSSFEKESAKEIFGSIGPYKTLGSCGDPKTPLPEQADCICAVDYYNYSCNDTCTGGGGCTTTDGGCSVFWLRDCTGNCSTTPQIERTVNK